jgi:hypothetical protein
LSLKQFLFYIFYIISLLCYNKLYASGLSAWTEKTPYGHELYHDGTEGGWITLSLDTTSVSFKYFYFYKGNTIAHSDSFYLIINEKTQIIQEYYDEKIWKTKLKEQNLIPFLEREYNSNYSSGFGNGIIFLLFFLPFPFLLPILWLICIISLAFPTRKLYGFRKHFSWIYPAIIFVVLMIDLFPQSI